MFRPPDLIPDPAELSQAASRDAMERLRRAVEDETAASPSDMEPAASHIRQATEKMASGATLRRMSEFGALAQFGAAPVGKILAAAQGAPYASPAFEALFSAEFFAACVLSYGEQPGLIPADLRARHGIAPEARDAAALRPVFDDLLDRAMETLQATRALPRKCPEQAFLKRRAAYCARLIRRLRRGDPSDVDPGPTLYDRIVVALVVALPV